MGSDTRIEFPGKALAESNNWTISGKLTESGKPLLANDPHRVVAVPSLRYMVHLVAPGWDVIGAGEPGLPGVALGHNQDIAWGFTIFGLDQQDLYLEEINPDNPRQYKTANGWETMTVEKETFAVLGQPAATEELKFTKHGPVMWTDAPISRQTKTNRVCHSSRRPHALPPSFGSVPSLRQCRFVFSRCRASERKNKPTRAEGKVFLAQLPDPKSAEVRPADLHLRPWRKLPEPDPNLWRLLPQRWPRIPHVCDQPFCLEPSLENLNFLYLS